MSFLELFFSYWWVLLFIPLPYFSYFIFNLYKIQKEKKNIREKKEEKSYLYEPVVTLEKKHLDIEIRNDDIPIYKKRIEALVKNLLETKGTVSISSVEAMLLVELYSDSVVITESGEFVTDVTIIKIFKFTKSNIVKFNRNE